MLTINRKPTTLAQKMIPEQWRAIAECAIARHRLSADRQDWRRCEGESLASSLGFTMARLAREPFPVTVAPGIDFYGSKPRFDCLSINRAQHIENAVNGKPLTLPSYLDEALSDEDKGWQDLICNYLQTIDDRNRQYFWQSLDIMGEHDLSGDIFSVAFYPAAAADYLWSRDCFLSVDGSLYDLTDSTIADCGILESAIGWHVADISSGEYIDGFDSLAAGYSRNPTGELEDITLGTPVWHHGLGCFVGRLDGYDRPVRLYPEPPNYGG